MKNTTKVLMSLVLMLTLIFGVGSVAYAESADGRHPLQDTDQNWPWPQSFATVSFSVLDGSKDDPVPFPDGYEFDGSESVFLNFDIDLTPANGSMYYSGTGPYGGWEFCTYALREAHFQGQSYGYPTPLPPIDENTVFTIPIDGPFKAPQEVSPWMTQTSSVGNQLFTWRYANGVIEIKFSKYVLEDMEQATTFSVGLGGTLDMAEIGNKSEVEISIPGDDENTKEENTITIPMKTNYQLNKSGDMNYDVDKPNEQDRYSAEYTVELTFDRDVDLSATPLSITDTAGTYIGAPKPDSLTMVSQPEGANASVTHSPVAG